MFHHRKGMDQRWRTHYRHTSCVIYAALVLFGMCFMVSLVLIWPQHYSSLVFDSKMMYRNILDVKDYWTCDPDYYHFVIDKPSTDKALLTMYVYNVTNADEVIQRGYKPKMRETGPYGYSIEASKYDVTFHDMDGDNPNITDSSQVFFQRWHILHRRWLFFSDVWRGVHEQLPWRVAIMVEWRFYLFGKFKLHENFILKMFLQNFENFS